MAGTYLLTAAVKSYWSL